VSGKVFFRVWKRVGERKAVQRCIQNSLSVLCAFLPFFIPFPTPSLTPRLRNSSLVQDLRGWSRPSEMVIDRFLSFDPPIVPDWWNKLSRYFFPEMGGARRLVLTCQIGWIASFWGELARSLNIPFLTRAGCAGFYTISPRKEGCGDIVMCLCVPFMGNGSR